MADCHALSIGFAHFDLNHKMNPLLRQSDRQMTLNLCVAESTLLENKNI